MRATEILREEHRVIERVLACLERIGDDLAATGRLDVLSARDAIAFLRWFADKNHHAKEACLYPAMERCGLGGGAGPTDLIRQEHYLSRGHIDRMEQAVDDWEWGISSAGPRFLIEARSFLDMMREHMANEDDVLFPVADRILPTAAQERLLVEFRIVDEREMGSETRQRFLDLAKSLASRWGVDERPRQCAHVPPGSPLPDPQPQCR